jgi:cytochrome P450
VLNGRSELTAADVPKLVVTEACFREALRLHPAVVQIPRDAAQDTTLLVRGGC